jgi:DNA polymerase-1
VLAQKLLQYKDQAFLSKRLATIRNDVPVAFKLDDIKWSYDVLPAAAAFFTELGFRSLVNRLNKPNERKETTRRAKTRKAGSGQGDLFSEPYAPQPVTDQIERLFRAGVFSSKIQDLELKLVPVIEAMQENGILIDVSVLDALAKEIGKEMAVIEKNITQSAGEQFNILSPPQLSKVMFEKLGIPTRGLRKTPGGVISTQSSELAKIRELHPLIALVERYRELAKLKSTYADALPALVDPKDGRVHTTYKQLGADTGRIASINPNLQNIPIRSELGRKIRGAFIAPPGFTLVSADYSQIELRVAAVISQDETLLETFKRGEDVHTTTAAQVFGVSEESVTPNMRRQAKVINFGVLYGMGVQGLAEAADITRPEAKTFIDTYFRSFPGIAKYVAETKRQARELGYVETMFGRKRYVIGLDSSDPRIRAAAERAAVNAPVQGCAADIIKMAMVAVAKKFPPRGPGVRTLLQVHDELVFEIKKDLMRSSALEIKKIMESVVEFPIPLAVDMKAGQNWEEMK